VSSPSASRAAVRPDCEPFRFDAGPVGVLLQHGFTGCPASMRPMGEWLAQRGVSAVGPRWPGHGTAWQDLGSVTWRDLEAESSAALEDMAARCTDVVVVGLSVGGAMALHLAATRPNLVRGVVAINALVRRPDLVLAPLLRRVVGSVKGVGNDIKKPGVEESAYPRIPSTAVVELGKFLRVVDGELHRVTQPIVVVSSTQDHTVKPRNSNRIIARAGSTRIELLTLTNSYHVATLDYDAPLVFERVERFARDQAARARTPGD
jgi:carboxylesterase